jgi:hypothetical protein
MSTYNYKPGLGLAAAYQVSSKPWVSGSINPAVTSTVTFPNVTSWVVISNSHANNSCKVGFSAAGVAGTNYITVPANSMSPRLELKLTAIHLAGSSTSVDILAGLTYIEPEEIDNAAVSPSGNNWAGSPGALVG